MCYNKSVERETTKDERKVTKMKKLVAKVNNLPRDWEKYSHIVAREVEGDLWFYGAWYDEDGARKQAREVGGVVVTVE